MQKNFIFWGSDEFSVKVLETLINSGHKPICVVTVPAKPVGRKKIITPTPISVFSNQNQIATIEEENIKSEEFKKRYSDFKPELAIVASYGKIIPEDILHIPTFGTFNVHPSILPKWRGPTPIEHIIMNDDVAGVTIIELDEKMDHGPIVYSEEILIENPDTNPYPYEKLREILAESGGKLCTKLFSDLPNISKIAQKHSDATFTKLLTKNDGQIDLLDNPFKNIRKIRALSNWPGTYFIHKQGNKDIRVIIKSAHIENDILVIDTVLPEGKSEMNFESFKRGYLERKAS